MSREAAEAKGPGRVYVVLVNWNGARDTVECLESLFRSEYPDFRVVVCDNDSSDGSVGHLLDWASGRTPYCAPGAVLGGLTAVPVPKPVEHSLLDGPAAEDAPCSAPLTIIRTGKNLGFAGGNNVGIRFSLRQGDCGFVWLLNNDTVVLPDTLKKLVARARSDRTIGIVGATLCFYDRPGTVQALGGASFNKYRSLSRLLGNERELARIGAAELGGVEGRLDWVSGASMLVTRRFLAEVGLMEESYFLYFEELDWALRAGERFRMGYAPGARVFHKHGAATNERKGADTSIYFRFRACIRLYRKLLPYHMPFCLYGIGRYLAVNLIKGRGSVFFPVSRALREEFF
ncbi:glycosyltransferase family 2 protein [Geomesophilobacter sediminis]|uniref:Glycosyltransferase family 2 protein n=1 Tax=Geomesophilobacter sediminis TaxID=2798584 RepID=A0A8J7LY80_9BACT|nr:glycosyltransferase family 2 protein [Geomesophilobacter sediminis]MBJ6724252.1 glycosyltransferase family 2 protein [Geomesophilobacter sediminis]